MTAFDDWERDGFFIVRGFWDEERCAELLRAAVDMARAHAAGTAPPEVFVVPEGHPGANAREPEDFVAKVFRLHDQPPFQAFARDEQVAKVVADLIGPDLDVFLSQFIFKCPEAYGQPWHQDSHYFPFEPDHQVGVWLAVTRATLQNGCLWVVPGSQHEPVHEHVPDDRPNATSSYRKVVDYDMSAAIPVEMEPGDLLVFDSHVFHSSTDNLSDEVRAAFVCHYSVAGTVDHTPPELSVLSWRPLVRDGALV